MKSLSQYITEKLMLESDESKTYTFDFAGLGNAEETAKSVEEYGDVDGTKVTLSVSLSDKAEIARSIIQKYYDSLYNSEERSSDETKAAKIKKIGSTLSDIDSYLDELENPEEE